MSYELIILLDKIYITDKIMNDKQNLAIIRDRWSQNYMADRVSIKFYSIFITDLTSKFCNRLDEL
mgnify:CR=1 FL=1